MTLRLVPRTIPAKVLSLLLAFAAVLALTVFLGLLPYFETELVRTREESLKYLVDTTMNLLDEYEARIAKGELTPEDGRKRAMERIKHMRYGQGDYFWINDIRLPFPTMIMHPTVPALDGKVLDTGKFNCATTMRYGEDRDRMVIPGGRKNLFQAFAEVSLKSGDGFVTYDWPKPIKGGGVTSELFPKSSYVRLFKPWGWIVGTGVYMDDLYTLTARIRLYTAIVTGSVIALALAAAFGILSTVSRPLKALVTFADEVSHGNLGAGISGRFGGELALLKESLEAMVRDLKARIGEAEDKTREAAEEAKRAARATAEAEKARQRAEEARREGMLHAAGSIETVVRRLGDASERLLGQVRQAGENTDVQKERVQATATSMEEMTSTVLDVARNASEAAESSDKARDKAHAGEKVVGEAVSAIGEVRGKAEELKAQMRTLGGQAESIGRIMEVISDIADQTNLLALNAAIEAARAGDAGRGFAVVADEVRKLAEKTMTATKEVGQAIKAIQDATRAGITGAEGAARSVESAAELAGRSGDVLREIVALAVAASDKVNSIATASEEQSAASEEINTSVEDVRRIAGRTSEVMAQAAGAVEELSQQAQVLKNLVGELQKG